MNDLGFEIRRSRDEDFSTRPPVFQNEVDGYAELMTYACWVMLFPEGIDEKPIYFMRNMNPDSYRWMGIIHPGETIIDYQTEAHVRDLAQGDAKVVPYHLEHTDPDTYVISSEEPYSYYSFSKDGGHWVEGKDGCVFDLEFTPFDVSHFEHQNSPRGAVVHLTGGTLTGTYEGKPVFGMGAYDRTFRPQDKTDLEANNRSFAYVSSYLSAIREDGRREAAYTSISTIDGRNGHGLGIYYIDGEEPILTNEVYLEDAVFRRLPYLPEGDHTVVLANGTWKFGGKEFHMDCKWGGKGFTVGPRNERVGQTQTYGTWYEGKAPYKQKNYHFFTESMGASEETISAMGFTVTD